ncbi:MAG: GspE/PulE family protein [Gemmatimonadales bacterium]
MPQTVLRSVLPLAESFRAEYLSYYRILPLEILDNRLRVAVAASPDEDALEDLRRTYNLDLELVPASNAELEEAIRLTFAQAESVEGLVKDLDASLGDPGQVESGVEDTRDLANQPPVIRLVNLLIRDAQAAGASDIHLEATVSGLRVRLRIDGVLTEIPGPPRGLQAAVISRLKLLAELDIAERRIPQDGRLRVRLEERELDLRVGTVPTLHGESIVLRLLERGGRPVQLEELGMDPEVLSVMSRLCRKSHGIVLSTGPTGSGKTTTLYAALGLRRPAEEKIVTVEDPVEYFLEGVTQVPVHTKAGVTFATALRSILRQDPDLLLIGEMRDAETASIAIQSALTGHLVFSTLHTNDAISAIPRLTDMGVEPYLVAATVEGVLGQRLVRRICAECRTRYEPDPSVVSLLTHQPIGRVVLERGAGCNACRQTGYRGRVGLFELFVMDETGRELIARGSDVKVLREALRMGMRTLREDGWRKVQAGQTTVEEVLRVLGG